MNHLPKQELRDTTKSGFLFSGRKGLVYKTRNSNEDQRAQVQHKPHPVVGVLGRQSAFGPVDGAREMCRLKIHNLNRRLLNRFMLQHDAKVFNFRDTQMDYSYALDNIIIIIPSIPKYNFFN